MYGKAICVWLHQPSGYMAPAVFQIESVLVLGESTADFLQFTLILHQLKKLMIWTTKKTPKLNQKSTVKITLTGGFVHVCTCYIFFSSPDWLYVTIITEVLSLGGVCLCLTLKIEDNNSTDYWSSPPHNWRNRPSHNHRNKHTVFPQSMSLSLPVPADVDVMYWPWKVKGCAWLAWRQRCQANQVQLLTFQGRFISHDLMLFLHVWCSDLIWL